MSTESVSAEGPSAFLALDRARETAGGNVGLSAKLLELGCEITSQAISQWKQVPPTRVLLVERATGVPRHELRPDIYPAPVEGAGV